MNIKKEVFNQLADFMKKEFNKIQSEINSNKYEFKQLTEKQTILKRKRAELTDLYNHCIQRKKIEE